MAHVTTKQSMIAVYIMRLHTESIGALSVSILGVLLYVAEVYTHCTFRWHSLMKMVSFSHAVYHSKNTQLKFLILSRDYAFYDHKMFKYHSICAINTNNY